MAPKGMRHEIKTYLFGFGVLVPSTQKLTKKHIRLKTMYVYLIKCMDKSGFIKVGMANNVESRMAALQIGCPYKLELIISIKCKSRRHAYNIENRIHKASKKYRVRGEWFSKVPMYDVYRMADYQSIEDERELKEAEMDIVLSANSALGL